jgi:hypothetical protein
MRLFLDKPSSAPRVDNNPLAHAEITGEESHHREIDAGPTNHSVDHRSMGILIPAA